MAVAPTISPESRLAATLDELFGRGPSGRVRVLEVACGDGYASLVVSRRLRAALPRARLVSFDLDLAAVAAGRARAGRAAGAAPAWLCTDLYRPAVAAGSVDYVVALNIFHGVDRGRFARTMHRLLRPEGLLLAYDRVPDLIPLPRVALILDRAQVAAVGRLGAGDEGGDQS